MKQLGVVHISGVDRIVQGQRAGPILKNAYPNLAEVMLAALVLPPFGQFGFGLGGHVGEVVRGIKEERFRSQGKLLPDAGKELGGDFLDVLFGHPVPLFPVAL